MSQPRIMASRVMGIDLGRRRIGVAATDALGLTVQPLETIARTSLRKDMNRIAELVQENQIAELVVGLPLHMSGEAGSKAERAQQFAGHLRARLKLPVHLFDERLTTWQAHQVLSAQSASIAKRKEVIDQVSAMLILEGWLAERRERRGRC
jgi:putative Holliday junction resolvase